MQRHFNHRLSTLLLAASLLLGLAYSPIATAVTTAATTSAKIAQATAPEPVTLDASTRRKLLNQVAKDTRIPVRRLKVQAAIPASFDGCLGLFQPGRACIQIAIEGWRTVVSDGQTSWVYHLNQNGTQIAQNSTASGAKANVFVTYERLADRNPEFDTNVVFESTISGDLMGSMTRIVLTQDGKVTSYYSAPNIRTMPKVIRTLTRAQIQQFKTLLDNQRFPNLSRLSYISSAALADYPTTTYQAGGTIVEFIDLEVPSVPIALRRVIKAWDGLIKP
jgi:hypothetical protein